LGQMIGFTYPVTTFQKQDFPDIRKILFLKSCDRISEAYHLAQSAYETYPDQPGLLCLLVELALRSGDFGFARQRLIEANKIKNPKILEHLLNLRLRLNLLENEINDLLKLEAIGAMETIISSEVYCANARIKISLDDWELATEFFGKAVEEIENKKAQVIGYIPGYDPIEEMMKSDPFWVYDTGCQLFKWKEYLPQYLEISNKNPKHYAILFGLIKTLVLAGEWIYLLASFHACPKILIFHILTVS
jgi:hypothetical protein